MRKKTLQSIKRLPRRLTSLLLLLFFSANLFSQISVDVKNKPVKEILKEIEKNSRFNFFYSEDLKDLDKVTSISVSDASLKNTLDALLKETAITFREQGVNIVYLFPKGTNPVTNDATKTLTGTVTDETGEAIIGANVVEKGKPGNGTATDLDGKYTLELPVNATLEVSYLGYTKQEVSVAGKTTINITLAENAKDLDEVIVIGYGTIKKADLTGAVASVGGEKLANLQATSISQALQGSMPGVQITRSGSMPGDGATIRVRGVTTIGTSDPLILIDGIPGSLNNVNVDDIESISVLKDAASASIYGARASAGVVLVTTKRAKEGSLSIDYSGTLGFVKATTFPGVVDYKRYMEMNNEVAWNDAGNVPGNEYFVYSKDYIESYAENNLIDPGHYPIADWKSYLINNSAPRQKHNLSMSYGNAVVKTKASVGYEKTDALYDHRSYESVTARVNNTIKLNKYLSASVDGSYLRTISERPQVNPLTAAYVYGPLWSPVWPDGRISDGRNGTNTYARLHYGGFNNTWGDHFTGRIALDFTPVKNFTITGVYAPTVSISKGKNFVKQIPYYEMNDPTLFAGYIAGHLENSLSESRGESRTTTKQLLANYAITLDKVHELSLLAGYEDYYAFSESLGASSNMMELSNYPYLDRGNLNFMTNSGTASENAYRSLFGRINYSFGDRYLLQANIRSDESSRFHRNYRRGTFPSVSAGWVITEEPSLKTADLGPLSFLKFRGSWGNLGNERVGNYPYQAIMAFGNAIFVNSAGVVEAVTTSAQQTYNVLDITWERTEVLDGGIDVALLNNRLSLSFDYYEKTTHDMLLALEIPDLMGYNNPQQNAGIMNTKGWDLLVEWKDKIGDLRYSISANLSDYKSVMGNLSGGVVFGDGTIIRKGSEYNEWYGYLSDGLFQTAEEVASSPTLTASTKPGDVKFKDVSGPDGVPDGKITPDYDRVLLGGSLPRYIYGGTINAGYKGIDLSLAFQGVGKQKSLLTSDQVYQTAGWYTFPDFVDGHYFSNLNTPEQNAQAKYPRLSQIGYQGNNYKMSDYWLIDGSYFRLKNITLGYTLPKHIVNRTQLSNVRLWASASDLFSISKFPKGWDPEAGTTSYITKGFNFGIQVKF